MVLTILGTSTLAGVAAYVAQAPAPVATTKVPAIEIDAAETPELQIHEVKTQREHAPSSALEFAFVITVGNERYVQLPYDEDASLLPTKGGRLVVDEYITSAVAPIRKPSAAQGNAWIGQALRVGACSTKIDGVAHVARLTGDPGYAGIEGDNPRWNAKQVFEHGTNMLVGHLAVACEGQIARDAMLAPAPVANAIDDPELAARARADLFASELAQAADDSWNDTEAWGSAPEEDWRKAADPIAKVYEHSETHEKWIVVHARIGGGCGERGVNLFGIYRAEGAKLVREYASTDSGIDDFEGLVDVDGDGRFEILASSWLGPDRALRDLLGNTLAILDVPFFGCPC